MGVKNAEKKGRHNIMRSNIGLLDSSTMISFAKLAVLGQDDESFPCRSYDVWNQARASLYIRLCINVASNEGLDVKFPVATGGVGGVSQMTANRLTDISDVSTCMAMMHPLGDAFSFW